MGRDDDPRQTSKLRLKVTIMTPDHRLDTGLSQLRDASPEG